MTVTVVLDTNALMMPVECDVRLFDELDRLVGERRRQLVPDAVLDELASLAEGAGEAATAASVGLDLADRCVRRETGAAYADDAVLELALTAADVGYSTDEPATDTDTDVDVNVDVYGVTNDGPLRERLLAQDVPVISLRGENVLAVTEP